MLDMEFVKNPDHPYRRVVFVLTDEYKVGFGFQDREVGRHCFPRRWLFDDVQRVHGDVRSGEYEFKDIGNWHFMVEAMVAEGMV